MYDLEGNYLGMEEIGLESPLLDPIDLIVSFGGLLRGIGKGVGSIVARATSRAQCGHRRANAFCRGDRRDADGFPAPIGAESEVYGNDRGAVREKDWTILHFLFKYGYRDMSSSGIPVKLQPRTAPCRAVAAWHSESALFVCSFEYSAEPPRGSATVAERIDAALGISAMPPRVLLGDVDLTWQDDSRLHSIELRTGRSQWVPSSLPIPIERADESSMTLGLEYDVNRIASIDVEVRVLWDAAPARLGLRFGNAELRFADVQIVAADAS